MDNETFVITSTLDVGDGDTDNGPLMNAQNQQNARLVTVSSRGTLNEVDETPTVAAEFVAVGEHGRRQQQRDRHCRGIRGGSNRRAKRWQKRPVYRVLNKYKVNKYRGHGRYTGLHGIRSPTVMLSMDGNFPRDVQIASDAPTESSVDTEFVVTDHLIDSERFDKTAPPPGDGNDGDVDTIDNADVKIGSKRKTRLVERRSQLVIIADNEDEADSDDNTMPSTSKGTYHIQKKRSSAAKRRTMDSNAAVIDSEPEFAPPGVQEPVILRPRPCSPNRSTIEIVYGEGLKLNNCSVLTARFVKIVSNLD